MTEQVFKLKPGTEEDKMTNECLSCQVLTSMKKGADNFYRLPIFHHSFRLCQFTYPDSRFCTEKQRNMLDDRTDSLDSSSATV